LISKISYQGFNYQLLLDSKLVSLFYLIRCVDRGIRSLDLCWKKIQLCESYSIRKFSLSKIKCHEIVGLISTNMRLNDIQRELENMCFILDIKLDST